MIPVMERDRSHVRIVEPRPGWTGDYDALAGRLRSALGALALGVEHIGSTAVPGLAAKDVIDVQVLVADLDAPGLEEALVAAGLVPRPDVDRGHAPAGDPDEPGHWRKRFLVGAPGDREVHVHVRRAGAPNARFPLVVRDYLRATPAAAAAYAELKRRLAAIEPPLDRGTYADIKDPAFDLIMLAAESWATATGWAFATGP
jgi:GrpB-like predicted nucleotidyltransferase (UPF0157 family)